MPETLCPTVDLVKKKPALKKLPVSSQGQRTEMQDLFKNKQLKGNNETSGQKNNNDDKSDDVGIENLFDEEV